MKQKRKQSPENQQPADGKLLQWHPAFFAGIQVDLDAENSELSYVNEHQLGTKPKQIDIIAASPG